ncbi:nucleotide sugar dehydrogenase [Crassaminicella profunda]|uniref:nucleotide sugar dehydrogenase n=1 Tax=Crassaminicella profunda TaxID=1286698 RepID=UPI001CA6674F|nr:nucleotide sugar dehydrogenase [Crassaminicella profunda]QZY57028.1 nucleotide sugar dehydrogenase [Crassaminicella profunda]
MKVYVFGLGHIGLPMTTWIALQDHQVTGIDINPQVVESIKNGTINIHEHYNNIHISKVAQNLITEKKLSVHTNYNRTNSEPSVFIITVGIAALNNGFQDISPIQNVLDTILPTLVDEDLLLFRTTMIPGTCDKLVLPQLQKLNKNIHLAYTPETILETRAFEEFQKNQRILAAIDDESYSIAESFLKSLSDTKIYRASTIKTAEMVKVVQNISRDVDIAFINELSEAASYLGVDIYELRALVNTHPRVELLKPGPGVGGYCLPNALRYLEEAFEDKTQVSISLMQKARRLNDNRPQKIVEIVKSALNDIGKDIEGSTIAIVGLAMKDYCADCRYSPALDIASLLVDDSAKVQGYDPLVPLTYPFQVDSFLSCIKNADCIVITAKQDHIAFDIEQICNNMNKLPVVVDTRNVFPNDPRIKLYRC